MSDELSPERLSQLIAGASPTIDELRAWTDVIAERNAALGRAFTAEAQVRGLQDTLVDAYADRDRLRADLALTAAELVIPMPTAGTDTARLLSANVLLRQDRDHLRADVERLTRVVAAVTSPETDSHFTDEENAVRRAAGDAAKAVGWLAPMDAAALRRERDEAQRRLGATACGNCGGEGGGERDVDYGGEHDTEHWTCAVCGGSGSGLDALRRDRDAALARAEKAEADLRDALANGAEADRKRAEATQRAFEMQSRAEKAEARLDGHAGFVGPCPHGRDPWDRCDVCGEGDAVDALRMRAEKAERERDEAVARGDRYAAIIAEDTVPLEQFRDAEAREAELRAALSEILDYRGGADSALDDEYVMDRARAALASATKGASDA